MNRVLVTGATGFVGSHALEALASRDDVTTVAACREPARLPSAAIDASGRVDVRPGDLRDDDYRRRVVEGVDVLVHAAAWTSLFGHAERSRAWFLEPTLALIDAARAAGVRRFVFVSSTSAAATGQPEDPMSPGLRRGLWPHLDNVVRIEDRLRQVAGSGFEVANLRFGLFAGRRYALGLLPILLPRLRTRLVPWVDGGRSSMAIVDGRDVGQALALAATATGLDGYESFNVVGPEVPSVREVLEYLQRQHGYPKPWFGVPFAAAYPFARLMELLDPLLPGDPLVTRSIIHLLEETRPDNRRAQSKLGYRPRHHWTEAVDAQLAEMSQRGQPAMPMHVPLNR